jgi:hypothetical protein
MTEEEIRAKFESLRLVLNERQRRLWAASEAKAIGHGGISIVARATGLSRTTIRSGRNELEGIEEQGGVEFPDRVRRPGAGRRPLEEEDPELLIALDILVEPLARGEPNSPLRWTCKSLRKLAAELTELGHPVSPQKVGQLLKAQRYSLQGNKKTLEGAQHPDRNAQFEHIANKAKAFQQRGQPVVSVDTKKKELVGPFKNGGREWRAEGMQDTVRVHDFIDRELGKAIPYGVYDIANNAGWVSVGTDHDTPEFAVATLQRWWKKVGRRLHPEATALYVTADAGGSNSYRSRVWKARLQEFANESGLSVTVSHYPPGTSKWNKIEHRMFSFISMNWRGQPLLTHEIIVNLIGGTTTKTGLRIDAELDESEYPLGVKVEDAVLMAINMRRDKFHGEWNYTISPQRHRRCR